jgi:CheY-like chemotaxis protein
MSKFKKILLVDDDPIQNLINTKLLRRAEISEEIDVAVNGKLAFDQYMNGNEELPELIFLDINMPIMNGWEFLDLLDLKGYESMPIIYMLTSSISPSDIEKSENHPMVTNYITKPLSLDKLKELKAELLSY